MKEQEAFSCIKREGICLFLLLSLRCLSETSVQTGGFQSWPWACGIANDDSILYSLTIISLPTFANKKRKGGKNQSKEILTSMAISCHFPSSRILIRIMWCYKVATESAFSGESHWTCMTTSLSRQLSSLRAEHIRDWCLEQIQVTSENSCHL